MLLTMSKSKSGPKEHPDVAKAIAYMAKKGISAYVAAPRFKMSRSGLYRAIQRRVNGRT